MPERAYDPATVSFTVTLHLKPGCEAEFLALLTPVLDAMRAEATFIDAVLHRDPDDPSRFMLYETWAGLQEVVEVQVHRDYRQGFWAGLPELLAEDRRIDVWKPIRGDFAR